MKGWTIHIIVVCATIVSLFGIAAYMAFSSSMGWQWFLLGALAISAGFDFSESDCDVIDDGVDNSNSNCNIHKFDGDNNDG